MPNNNGDFLSCMREVEEGLDSEEPPAFRKAVRKLGTHIIRMHQKIEELVDSHTDETTGRPYDVHKAYAKLDGIEKEVASMRRLLWTAQIGVYIVGTLAPIILALTVYAFNEVRKQVEQATMVNLEQTIMLERVQTVQRSVVEQLRSFQESAMHRSNKP